MKKLLILLWAFGIFFILCLSETIENNKNNNDTDEDFINRNKINESSTKTSSVVELSNGAIIKVREKENLVLKCPLEGSSEILDESLSISDSEISDPDYENDENIENQETKTVQKRSTTPQQSQKIKNTEFVIVQWYKDSIRINKLTSSPRYKTNNAYLKIKNLNPNDSGNFKCKIINGFGSSTFNANLIVEGKKQNQKVLTDIKQTSAPVFINFDQSESRNLRRMKGTQIKLKCKAQANPKPEILWFKNGEILSEEEYGITRSKWTLELKDLRMSDNGNFTCQIFNKYGVINATFELEVYEDSQIFEGYEPFNTTILTGMDAVFSCKVKSHTLPNIKWMKQISKAEYVNYVLQSNGEEEVNDPIAELGLGQNENTLNSFFLKTESPLSLIKTLDDEKKPDLDASISDLMGTDAPKDELENYKIFLSAKNLLKTNMNVNTININNKNNLKDESVHYITLTSSPLTEQKVTFNEKENYYVSQLTIKQANIKDNGIYVCFGANSKGYSYRKAHLKVIQRITPLLPAYNNVNSFNKNQITVKSSNNEMNYQSMGVLIVLVPVSVITIFAIVSIYLLKRFNDQKNLIIKNNDEESVLIIIKKCLFKCCLPDHRHTLIDNETLNGNKFIKSNQRKRNASYPSTTNSLGSSVSSDSSSTTATTVAYYATIPLLVDNGNLKPPPPPLPNSQPPNIPQRVKNSNLERTVSTPSMAYYKIVENEVDEGKQGDDAFTCVSSSSRHYYQLTPNGSNFNHNS